MRTFILCVSLLAGHLILAQARNSNWIIGSGAWLHLSPDQVISIPMQDTVSLRNASISSIDGQFLLLADDFGIRNSLFNTIDGGTPSALDWNVPAGNYLILPRPGYPSQYAVFINELPPSTRAGMVLVDMAANGGAGGVISNGTLWYMEQTTAKLTATSDAEEEGYWILQHKDTGHAFHAYRLTSSGLLTEPVISYVGSYYSSDTGPADNTDRRGQMNFSFQGDRLAVVKNAESVDTSKVELFNFDRNTGMLSWWAEIGVARMLDGIPYPPIHARMKGVDFDTSGQFPFVGHEDTTGIFTDRSIIRFDLTAAPPDSLVNQIAPLSGFGVPQPGHYDSRYGSNFAAGPYGYMLAHPLYPAHPVVPQQQFLFWETPPADTYFHFHAVLEQTRVMGGFPAPCKRYVDAYTLGVADIGLPSTRVIGISPNPIIDRAVLALYGTEEPVDLVWRDSLGRVLRRERVKTIGAAYIINRDGLSAGTYTIEVRGSNESLGVVQVICM